MIGDNIKVHLPGESPWARILELAPGKVKAKIINRLFHQHSEHVQAQFMKREFGSVRPLELLHDYKQGDELWFEKDEFNEWVPA